MHRSRAGALVVGLLLAVGLPLTTITPAAAGAAEYVVTTVDDTVEPGDGVLSLREAVDLANADGTDSGLVLEAGATYQLKTCTVGGQEYENVSGSLDLAPDGAVTVTGNGATIEQTCDDDRVLLTEAPITVRQLTITGGAPIGPSGGTGGGGGIYAYGTVTVEDTTFTGNSAWGGASIYAGGDVSLLRTVISGNTGTTTTAGVSTVGVGADVHIRDSVISGNDGGATAVVHALGELVVENSTVTANDAFWLGISAAVLKGNSGVTLRHATVTDNTSNVGAAVSSITGITLEASILVNDGDLAECDVATPTMTSGGGNVIEDATCGTPEPTDQTGITDPHLAGLPTLAADAGLRPLPGSPAIDALPAAACSATLVTDQRGQPRPAGDGCDAGSVEVQVRPDGLVRRGSGPFRGDGIHNLTAVGQTRSVVVGDRTTTVFTIRVDNDGEQDTTVVVKGPKGQGRVTARYRSADQDVTASVVAGREIPLAAGDSATIGLRVIVARGAPAGLERAFTVRVRTTDGGEDRVRAAVRVR